jgi:hypothetical protein
MVFPRTADEHLNLYLSLLDTLPQASHPALEALWMGVSGSMDADWTMRYLMGLRDPVASRNELDCWILRLQSGHPNGYVEVNLHNTHRPGALRDMVIGCQPYVHRLTVVARGGGAALLNVGHEVASVRKSADRRHLTSVTVRGASIRSTYTSRPRRRTGTGRRAADSFVCGAGVGL